MSAAGQDSKITKTAKEFALGVLKQSVILSKLSDAQLLSVVEHMALMQCPAGQIIVQMGAKARRVVLLQHGECIAAKTQVDDKTTVEVCYSRERIPRGRDEAVWTDDVWLARDSCQVIRRAAPALTVKFHGWVSCLCYR
jgi:hypothetical protein